jgi:phosphatidylserine/phosphatidylglycerophosphate/cardiolipin synthase-like enzyme
MIQAARREIFVVGYLITSGARDLIVQLASARRDRRLKITFIGNRLEAQLSTLQSLWPNDTMPPEVFSRERVSIDDRSALHAKLLICDGNTALITSANFSHYGLHENIEVGVKIHSTSIGRLVEFVNAMIITGEVQPVNWSRKTKVE